MSAPAKLDPSRLDCISSRALRAQRLPARGVDVAPPARRRSFWYEHPNVDPFWAITKHADIIEIRKQPRALPERAAPRGLHAATCRRRPRATRRATCSTWIRPTTRGTASVASQRFTPRAIRAHATRRSSASRARCSTTPADGATHGDFVARRLGAHHDRGASPRCSACRARTGDLLFRWTNEMIAPQDPEFQRRADAERDDRRARASSSSRTSTSWSSDRRATPTRRHRERRRERRASTASRCPGASCSRTTSCSSSPATRRRATR